MPAPSSRLATLQGVTTVVGIPPLSLQTPITSRHSPVWATARTKRPDCPLVQPTKQFRDEAAPLWMGLDAYASSPRTKRSRSVLHPDLPGGLRTRTPRPN